MPFSEDDLRTALKREDPGERFTQRVMARIHQAESKSSSPRQKSSSWPSLWRLLKLRAALACVLMAGLVFASWLGVARYRQAQERQAAQQAISALKITTTKLNQVFERVKGFPGL